MRNNFDAQMDKIIGLIMRIPKRGSDEGEESGDRKKENIDEKN